MAKCKLAINGAGGRMGRRLLSLACADPDIELVQAIEYAASPLQGKVRGRTPLRGPCGQAVARLSL